MKKSILHVGNILKTAEQKQIKGGFEVCECPCAPDPLHCNVPGGVYYDCYSCLN
jgi:hypothetical protein